MNYIIRISKDKYTKIYQRLIFSFKKFLRNLLNISIKEAYGLVEAWYSLEQYIGLKEDKLSSTTVDFIRSEGNLETKHLYWFRNPKMC